MGRKNKPYSDKSAPYATMGDSPDDYLYKKGKKQKLVGSADNSPEDGEEELEEAPGDFFNVDGFIYRQHEIEDDEGFYKRWHYMVTPDGEEIYIDYSPYQDMEKEEFVNFVEKFRRSSLKETNMTDELNELRKAAGLPIVEDSDDDFEPATNMCPDCEGRDEHKKGCERCGGEGEIFEDCDQSEEAEKNDDGDCSPFTHADENVEMVREEDIDESDVDEDFLAPPQDIEDGEFEDDPRFKDDYADRMNDIAGDYDVERTEPELDSQTDYNAPPRDDGDDSFDLFDDTPIDESTYTRKDFRMVADTLLKIEDPIIRQSQAEEYAAKFAASNPLFNKDLFMNAAGVDYVDEDANTHAGREFASSEFGGEGGNTHVGREFSSSEMVEGPGDDEFAHDDDAMVDIGDEEYSDSDDLSDLGGGEFYGDSQYYETIEMNELRKAAGLEQVTEAKGMVDLTRWYEYEHGDVMSQIYWLKRQLPPADGSSAYARNWNKVVRNLSKKNPPPEGWVNPVGTPEPEEQTCPVCRGRGVNYSQNDEPCYKCDGEGTIIETIEMNEEGFDPRSTGDDYVYFNFNNEQAYYAVADEIGDRIIFGMNNEVGIPELYVDKMTNMLVKNGFDAQTDFVAASVEEDLQNGYDDKRYADGDDFFPKGSHQSPSDDLGPTASGYGDNAMKNKMRSKETDAVYESMRQSYRRHRKA